MKHTIIRCLLAVAGLIGGTSALMAQNSMPAPGSGGSFTPAPPAGGPGPGPGPGFGPGPGWGPGMGPGWSSGWGNPWYGSTIYYNPVYVNNVNSGYTSVVGCGYDATGVWRVVPMKVHYLYNGVVYNVTVVNAWDPWTATWDYDVDVNAVNTTYTLRGTTYNFYVVLSYGTFYFNL